MYRLVDRESDAVLVEAIDVEGLFPSSAESASGLLTFRGVTRDLLEDIPQPDRVRRALGLSVLDVVNRRGENLGRYAQSEMDVLDPVPSERFTGLVDRSFGVGLPDEDDVFHSFAGELWRRWVDVPAGRAEWMEYPVEWHRDWLHVVMSAWFFAGKGPVRCGTDPVVEVDGRTMLSRAGMYCALGEAVNGPRGYFGCNLDGMDDCLRSTVGGNVPFRLVWRYFETSRRFVGTDYVERTVEILREHGVDVVITGTTESTRNSRNS
ncbi:barstar family protein [Stackebrandtia soli]|uniref:barstar family protein n=1 Tax=Stackebrandtia soli TaxID=1892856 RepID=UPI0039E97CFC